MTRVLSLFGGWPGHTPYASSAWADELYDELGYEVERSSDIFTLDRDLTGFDLIVIGWSNALTTEALTTRQEDRLLGAVEAGTGVAGWHSAAAVFRASLRYRMLLGGDFIEHPAGEAYPQPYVVRVTNHDHPVSQGVHDFHVASEQYYVHANPNNVVLAETTFSGEHLPWLEGHTSPVAWVRAWGAGRVFYHSIGHTPADLDIPDVRRLTRQGLEWAKRA